MTDEPAPSSTAPAAEPVPKTPLAPVLASVAKRPIEKTSLTVGTTPTGLLADHDGRRSVTFTGSSGRGPNTGRTTTYSYTAQIALLNVLEKDPSRRLFDGQEGTYWLLGDPRDPAHGPNFELVDELRRRHDQLIEIPSALSTDPREVVNEIDECTCVTFCDEDRASACSLSGVPHVHPAAQGDGFGPCPVHPERPGDE